MLHGSRAHLLQKFITEMLCNYSTSHLRRFMNGTVNFNALQLIRADFPKCFSVSSYCMSKCQIFRTVLLSPGLFGREGTVKITKDSCETSAGTNSVLM